MKRSVACLIVASASLMACPNGESWPQQIATPASDWVLALASDPTGGFVIAGNTGTEIHDGLGAIIEPGNPSGFLSSYDEHGSLRWSTLGDGAQRRYERGLTVLDNGWICDAWSSDPVSVSEAWVLDCLDASGELQWTRSFDAEWSVEGLMPAGEGRVEVIGDFDVLLGDPDSTEIDAFAIQFDEFGDPFVSARFGQPVRFRHSGQASNGSGARYVWGYSSDVYFGLEGDESHLVVIRVEVGGEIGWTHAIGEGSAWRARGQMTPEGDLVLADQRPGVLGITRFDPHGTVVWDAELEPGGSLHQLVLFEDRIYLGGSENHTSELSTENTQNVFVTELSADGELLQRWEGDGHYLTGLSAQSSHLFVVGSVWDDYGPHEHQGGYDIYLDRLSRPLD